MPRIFLTTGILITLIFGFLCGFHYGGMKELPSHPIQFVDDINPYVPYMKILGLTNNELQIETTAHSLRIENGESILTAPPESSFTIPIAHVIATTATSNVAAPCAYAAAKTGKYLYPAESSQAKRLSDSKRCFTSIEEGEKAGLSLWKSKG